MDAIASIIIVQAIIGHANLNLGFCALCAEKVTF